MSSDKLTRNPPKGGVVDQATLNLHHWLVRVAKGDGGGRVSLGHLSASVSGPGVALGQWAVRQEDTREALFQLAESIVEAAVADTDGQLGGTPQQYVTLFYMESAPDKSVSRLPFYIASVEQFAPEGSALATEPPTGTGMISQAIRHNEFLVKASFGAMGSACSNLERQNLMMGEQLLRQTEQIFSMQQERQELLDRDAERMLKIEKFEAERDHRDRLTSEGISVVKGLIATASNGGKPLMLPVSTTFAKGALALGTGEGPDAEGIVVEAPAQETVPAAAVLALSQMQDFFRSLTPEQTAQVTALLTPMQQGSLFTLYQLFAGVEEGSVDA